MSIKREKEGPPHSPSNWSSLMCDGTISAHERCTEAKKKKDRQMQGGKSQEERVKRQTGRNGKHARQSEEEKGKCKARVGDWEKKIIMIA